MELSISFKQLGKKRPLIKDKFLSLNLNETNISVEVFLNAIVEHQVGVYNNKNVELEDEDSSKQPLEADYLDILSETGKVGFGSIYNSNKVVLTDAQENVIQAFKDGIFALFYGEDELTNLSAIIDLTQNKNFTFIRLTFLAGSYW